MVHKDRLDQHHVEQMDPVVGPRMQADQSISASDYIGAVRSARALRASLAVSLGTFVTVYAFLCLASPTNPSKPEPNNHIADGTGTALAPFHTA